MSFKIICDIYFHYNVSVHNKRNVKLICLNCHTGASNKRDDSNSFAIFGVIPKTQH